MSRIVIRTKKGGCYYAHVLRGGLYNCVDSGARMLTNNPKKLLPINIVQTHVKDTTRCVLKQNQP